MGDMKPWPKSTRLTKSGQPIQGTVLEIWVDTPAGVLALLDTVEQLRVENIELNELFDLQHKRTTEAVEAWRAADPDNRKGILPDLGALLEWLLDQARRAVDERQTAHLAEVMAERDQLREGSEIWNQHWDTDDEVDRLRADLEAAEETIKAQKADMGKWAVRWQEQFDRAERAEAAVPGPSQPTDCPSDAAADLRGPGETPHSVCPHVQTSEEGTSYCTLAAAPGEQLAEAREDAERWRRTTELLVETMRTFADEMDGSGYYPATGWAYELRVACDQAEGAS